MKTPEDLAKIKEALQLKHKKVIEVEVPMDEDDESVTATIFLRKPDNVTRSIIAKLVDKDPMKALEATLKNIYIGGDELSVVLANEDALPSLDGVIAQMLDVQKAVIKKN